MNREREENIERASKKEKSWELLRECTKFIKENEKTWILDPGAPKQKTKQENKKRKLELARIQKEETLTRLRQKKISETWNLLPETARRKLLAE